MTDDTSRIGIDIGGTKIEGILIDASGSVVSTYRIPSRPGEERVVEDVCRIVANLTSDPLPIGIGIPGQVDHLSGQISNVVNLGISTLNLADRISKRTGSVAHIENDVNAAALGAARIIADHPSSDHSVAFVNLGTGLAAGLVLDGTIVHGVSGSLGEIGHLPVDPNGFECSCGQHGCLETVASGGAVSRLWPTAGHAMPDLISKTSHGDQLAKKVLGIIMHAIADTVQITVQAYDPDLVIIGGGMARTGRPLIDSLVSELGRRAKESPFVANLGIPERIRLAPMDKPIGAIGAALSTVDIS